MRPGFRQQQDQRPLAGPDDVAAALARQLRVAAALGMGPLRLAFTFQKKRLLHVERHVRSLAQSWHRAGKV